MALLPGTPEMQTLGRFNDPNGGRIEDTIGWHVEDANTGSVASLHLFVLFLDKERGLTSPYRGFSCLALA